MADKNRGWIKLHRKIQECDIWAGDDEPFDRRSAWIDLLLMANHSEKVAIFDGTKLVIRRGQLLTSVRKLATRWGWGKDRTLRYLRLLEELQMIDRESNARRTLLTLVNYEVYQVCQDSNEDTSKDTDKDTDETLTRTLTRHSRDTDKDTDKPQTRINKNVKNVEEQTKNEKNIKNINNTLSDAREVIRMYNLYCPTLPECQKETDNRLKTIQTRLKKFTLDDFITVFQMAEQSDFLSGRSGSWTSCNIDWLIKESNMVKVLEGNYKNRDKRQEEFESFDRWAEGGTDFEGL